MQSIEASIELDFKKTNEEWEGKWLTEDAYDTVIHTKDYEGVNIFSPAASLDPYPIATVVPNVYDSVSHETIVRHLLDIDETSTMRANAAGPIDHEEMKAKGLVEDEDYKLRTPNSYYLKKKDGTWNDIASGNPIHSIMAGYKRGRFTGKIQPRRFLPFTAKGNFAPEMKEFEKKFTVEKENMTGDKYVTK